MPIKNVRNFSSDKLVQSLLMQDPVYRVSMKMNELTNKIAPAVFIVMLTIGLVITS